MNIIQDFIPAGRGNRPGAAMSPKYITIHDTANKNKGANALMHAKYLKGDTAANLPVSWHYTVDDQHIVQHLPLNEHGWHAGDGASGPGNRSSIGIEICENVDGDRAKAEENAAKLTAELLKQLGLTIDSVVQHNRWSGKNCPHVIRSRTGGWEEFLTKVKSYLEGDVSMGRFKDVPAGHWAETSIEKAAAAGVITGVTEGEFGLGQPVTREQIAVILDRLGLLDKK